MAFIALGAEEQTAPETLGVVRAIFDPDNERGEFAIIVRSDMKGKGLGHALLDKLVRYCRARGTARLIGKTVTDNQRMIELAKRLGFRVERNGEEVDVSLTLRA